MRLDATSLRVARFTRGHSIGIGASDDGFMYYKTSFIQHSYIFCKVVLDDTGAVVRDQRGSSWPEAEFETSTILS